MDVLSYLKFWRPSPSTAISIARFLGSDETDNIFDEEDDSFFELEFTKSCFDTNSYSYNSDVEDGDGNDDDDDDDSYNYININNSVVEEKNARSVKTATTNPSSYSAKVSPTLGDLFSKRRVIPLDTNYPSPESPASSPKMVITPRFRVFNVKKSSSKSKPSPEQEETQVKKVQVQPKLANSNNNKSPLENSYSLSSDSKRFSKETLQKYLKLVKPSSVKVSCKDNEVGGERDLATTPTAAAARTVKQPKRDPLAGIRLAGKRLGKSKLDDKLKAASSPARRDDSLAQQHDGIEGAILHCKRSFNSGRGRDMTMLSRSPSSPLYEKFLL